MQLRRRRRGFGAGGRAARPRLDAAGHERGEIFRIARQAVARRGEAPPCRLCRGHFAKLRSQPRSGPRHPACGCYNAAPALIRLAANYAIGPTVSAMREIVFDTETT